MNGSLDYITLSIPNATSAEATGIGDNGQITGAYVSGGAPPVFGYIQQGGATAIVQAPLGYNAANVDDINNYGTAVGTAFNIGSSSSEGFIVKSGVLTPLNVPGAFATSAQGINNHGDIVGYYQSSATAPAVGFLYVNGHFVNTHINDPQAGSGGTYASGINDRDQIVGYYYDSSGNEHGFIDTNGHYMTVDVTINGVVEANTEIYAINNRDEIVGDYTDSSGHTHGYIGENGHFMTLDVPGSALTVAQGINNSGTVVGFDRMEAHGPATAFRVDTAGSFV